MVKEALENAVKFIEIFPFSVEDPPLLHYHHFQHVFDVVVEPAIVLDQSSNYLHAHHIRIAENHIRDVE